MPKKRAICRSIHAAVGLNLHELIEDSSAEGSQRAAKKGVQKKRDVHAAMTVQPETDEGRDNDQRAETELRQQHEIAHGAGRVFRGSAAA